MIPGRLLPPIAVSGALALALGCGGPPIPSDAGRTVEEAVSAPGVHAILLNGGGSPRQNFHSHRLHVSELVQVLAARGVPRDRITVFASDGADPEADLAVRTPAAAPYHWLIRGLAIEEKLRPRRYENSTYEGLALHPARKEALEQWFRGPAQDLEAGDTLLIYVTDHGVRNDDDLKDNAIVLWGEELSVNELRDLLALLPDGVRVVTLMSQCFSGSFANVIYDATGASEPDGSVCGYFSSTAERRAYGCYAENRGRENVGHSFHFIEAMRTTPRFPEAHAEVLVSDRTPDVPNRTSDHYLQELIRREAESRGLDVDQVTRELLDFARENPSEVAAESDLVGKVRAAFGLSEITSIDELTRNRSVISGLDSRLTTYGRRWTLALDALKQENLENFLRSRPEWRERTSDGALTSMNEEERERTLREFLGALGRFSESDVTMWVRLETMREWRQLVDGARYRAEVRLASLERLRALLTRLAGRVYLEALASPEERRAFEEVDACEGLALASTESPLPSRLAEPSPFPDLAEDLRLAQEGAPGWIGISYASAEPDSVAHPVDRGAVVVQSVKPGSPAERAGLRVGDVVLGPPGSHFAWKHEIRDWTMLSPPGRVAELELLRGGALVTVTIRPDPYPLRLSN